VVENRPSGLSTQKDRQRKEAYYVYAGKREKSCGIDGSDFCPWFGSIIRQDKQEQLKQVKGAKNQY